MLGFYNYTVILTYVGVGFGVMGVFAALHEGTNLALICLMLAGLCDGFDGKIAARRVRNEREMSFGVQIDSLSDLLCFGILPVIIGHSWGARGALFYLISALYILAALIRLAYFNVLEDERRRSGDRSPRFFLGVPTTTAAFIFPLVLIAGNLSYVLGGADIWIPLHLGLMAVTAVSFLCKIRIPKPSGKGKLVLSVVWVVEFAGVMGVLWWLTKHTR